jgi:glycosyltransferase involved in cell wall biosynthesis
LKIVIDVSPLQNGHRSRGIGAYTRGLLQGLASLEADDTYYLYYWRGLELDRAAVGVPRGARWIPVPLPRLGRVSALVAQQVLLLPMLRSLSPDVYHQLGVVADLSAGGLPWHGLRFAVATLHDLTPLVYPDGFLTGKRARSFIYKRMLRALRRLPSVIVDSDTTRLDASRMLGIRSDRLTVVPLAVDPTFAAALADSGPSDRPRGLPASYLLTVGGDHPNKGISTLLAAYALAAGKSDVPDVVLVGHRGRSMDRVSAENPRLASRIHRFDYLDPAALAQVYRHATAVIVPSDYEGFGLPVLEAMAAGTPVIVSDAPSLLEVAGDAALVVPRRDPPALAAAIERVCQDPALREGLVRRGRERVGQFSWERTATLTYDAYRAAACA